VNDFVINTNNDIDHKITKFVIKNRKKQFYNYPKKMNRINQLLDFLEKEPNDNFLLYAIATEYLKTDTQKAVEYFENLLQNHADYIPTYYHAAELYANLEEYKKANKTYLKGIEMCQELIKKAQEQNIEIDKVTLKSLQELKSAYELFLMEFEDDF
jgi:tetratricopeptide (TPR) repeat protein